MSNINTAASNIPIPDSPVAQLYRSRMLQYHTARHMVQPQRFRLPTAEEDRQNKEAVILVTLLAALDYFIYDLIDELTEVGMYRQANKRAVNRAKDIIIKAHTKFYGAMMKYDDGKGIRQYNDAMDKFYAAINECVALTPPERAYNIVVAICRLQMSQNDKLTYHSYVLSKEVAKIPKMLECLGIHDYGLDRIIYQRIRPIVFNQEYK